MNTVMNELASVLRGLLKLVLVLVTAALGLVFLLAAVVVVMVSVLWSLLRGRKPMVFTTYTRFQQATQAFRQGGGWPPSSSSSHSADAAEVVDVQAREVPDQAPKSIERDDPPR